MDPIDETVKPVLLPYELFKQVRDLIIKAKDGNTDAMFELGLLYWRSEHTDLAIEWLTKAANNNHVEAMYELGILYISTDNEAGAISCLSKASSNGHVLAKQEISERGYERDRSNSSPPQSLSSLSSLSNDSNSIFNRTLPPNEPNEPNDPNKSNCIIS